MLLGDDEMTMSQCFGNLLFRLASWRRGHTPEFSFCLVSAERGGGVELLASIG